MIGGGPISPEIYLKHTDIAIYGVTGGMLNFWLQIQNLCKIRVQMIYRLLWLVQVEFFPHMANIQI